jgi:asparagine synthase (glutamine-hydrolysing)
MCGIAGIVYQNDSLRTSAAAVRRMIALQRHRGPDGEGFYDTTGASLGHCRLAIVDLSETGHQPMCDTDGRYWITYNRLRNLGTQILGVQLHPVERGNFY